MRTLYLHIGAHRTGTTYLQTSLHRNRDVLARHGVDTLSDLALWGQGHHNVALSYLNWPLRDVRSTADQYRQLFCARLRDCTQRSTIVSSEFFELFDDAAVDRLRPDLAQFRLVLIYWVRRQPQYLESFFRESFKQGLTESFASWMERRVAAGLGDFHAVARRWTMGLGVDVVRIVIYENLLQERINIFEFFAREILGVPAGQALELPEDALINRSIDKHLMWLLREMNLRHGRAESHVAGISAEYLRMRRRLERIYYSEASFARDAGPAKVIDAETARSIDARFEACNARLLTEFGSSICNPAPGGKLFAAAAPAPAETDPDLASASVEASVLLDLLFRALVADGEAPDAGGGLVPP
jgi:hypothetical protein